MGDIFDQSSLMVQNLNDAGCNEAFVKQFMLLLQNEAVEQQLELLAKHRAMLLETLHETHKQIDCLDYLVYKLKQSCH